MKIKKIEFNNKKRCFELIATDKRKLHFPYSKLRLHPSAQNKIKEVFIDKELGNEAFTYVLESGKSSSIHLDQVLEYNKDSSYLREMLLYKLSLHAQKILEKGKISKREIIRRLGTSPTQFYRLIDQTFYNKTIDQMVKLLAALDCPIDIVFKHTA